jgi:hypothetical protein
MAAATTSNRVGVSIWERVTDDLVSLWFSQWLDYSSRHRLSCCCKRFRAVSLRSQSSMTSIIIHDDYVIHSITSHLLNRLASENGLFDPTDTLSSITMVASRLVRFEDRTRDIERIGACAWWTKRLLPYRKTLRSVSLHVEVPAGWIGPELSDDNDAEQGYAGHRLSHLSTLSSSLESLSLVASFVAWQAQRALISTGWLHGLTTINNLRSLSLPRVQSKTLVMLPITLTCLHINVADWPPLPNVMRHLLSLPLRSFSLVPDPLHRYHDTGAPQQHTNPVTSEELTCMAQSWRELHSLSLAMRLNLTAAPSSPSLATINECKFAPTLQTFTLRESHGMTSSLLEYMPSIITLNVIDSLPLFDVIASRCPTLHHLTISRSGQGIITQS